MVGSCATYATGTHLCCSIRSDAVGYPQVTHTTMTVFAQQHPNHDAWGDTVTYTLVGDQVLVITDQQMIVMTREDARVEWAQNQHQGWRRIK